MPGRNAVTFAGCPAKHIADVDAVWFAAYKAWKYWNKTPPEMGLSLDRLDPRYWEAIEVIEWASQTYRKDG